jgi:hypothetical protein
MTMPKKPYPLTDDEGTQLLMLFDKLAAAGQLTEWGELAVWTLANEAFAAGMATMGPAHDLSALRRRVTERACAELFPPPPRGRGLKSV